MFLTYKRCFDVVPVNIMLDSRFQLSLGISSEATNTTGIVIQASQGLASF